MSSTDNTGFTSPKKAISPYVTVEDVVEAICRVGKDSLRTLYDWGYDKALDNKTPFEIAELATQGEIKYAYHPAVVKALKLNYRRCIEEETKTNNHGFDMYSLENNLAKVRSLLSLPYRKTVEGIEELSVEEFELAIEDTKKLYQAAHQKALDVKKDFDEQKSVVMSEIAEFDSAFNYQMADAMVRQLAAPLLDLIQTTKDRLEAHYAYWMTNPHALVEKYVAEKSFLSIILNTGSHNIEKLQRFADLQTALGPRLLDANLESSPHNLTHKKIPDSVPDLIQVVEAAHRVLSDIKTLYCSSREEKERYKGTGTPLMSNEAFKKKTCYFDKVAVIAVYADQITACSKILKELCKISKEKLPAREKKKAGGSTAESDEESEAESDAEKSDESEESEDEDEDPEARQARVERRERKNRDIKRRKLVNMNIPSFGEHRLELV